MVEGVKTCPLCGAKTDWRLAQVCDGVNQRLRIPEFDKLLTERLNFLELCQWTLNNT